MLDIPEKNRGTNSTCSTTLAHKHKVENGIHRLNSVAGTSTSGFVPTVPGGFLFYKFKVCI